MPLLSERNKLYNQWLSTRQERDRLKFAAARNAARLSVRHAKEAWFESKAVEAEKARFSGKIVWKCIRNLQRCRRGLIPVRSSLVRMKMAMSALHWMHSRNDGLDILLKY